MSTTQTLANYCDYIKKQAEKSPFGKYLNTVEEKTGAPKEYVIIGAVVMIVLCIFFGFGSGIITNLIGFVYPIYGTIMALEDKHDFPSTQWLMYWVVFSFIHILEGFVEFIIYWVPFYYPLKTIFLLYLMLPQFNGSRQFYDVVIRPTALKFLELDLIDAKLGAAIGKAEVIATAAVDAGADALKKDGLEMFGVKE